MLFSSSIFLFLFLPLVILGYQLLKGKVRIYFLTLASLFFYAWGEPKYILVMLFSIALNYASGLCLNACGDRTRRRNIVLALSVISNLGVLFYYKYLGFTVASVNQLLHTSIPVRNIVMPIGISFFTFQGMSYVIDLYLGNVRVQKNPAYIAFYISFFPQLIAGPIVRYIDIQDQIYARNESIERFTEGAQRFIIGLAKKVILANTVGYAADQIFSGPAISNTPSTAWLGVLCYAFQIYFDFSGYSCMAIGLGKMFGFDFLENFKYPYISKTVTEFWRRWHISLSTWFRDYLYIPLGGNRRGNVYVNLSIVFLVTGIWHGASMNFIVWGLWFGLWLILERLTKTGKVEKGLHIPLRWAMTMLIVLVGWVLFRADNLSEAMRYLGIMFGFLKPENVVFTVRYYLTNRIILALLLSLIASLPLFKSKWASKITARPFWRPVSLVLSLVLFFVSIVFVCASSYNPFIYFRF